MGDAPLPLPLRDLGVKLWQWLVPQPPNPGGWKGNPRIAVLPFEIMAAIFLVYQDNFYDPTSQSKTTVFSQDSNLRRVAAAPIVLGAVCSQWRQITMSIPELWSKVCILVPCLNDITFLVLWLHRSGAHCPLDLRIDEQPGLGYYLSPILFSLLEIAASQSHRWRHVELHLKNSTDHFLQAVPALPLPALETLGLDFYPTLPSSQLYRSLYTASNLTGLRYDGPNLVNVQMPYTPWERLSTLKFNTRIKWDVLAGTLVQCRSLVHLAIDHIDFDNSIFHVESGTIQLHALTKLSLGPHLAQPDEFFGSLEVPSLLELHLNRTFGYRFHDAYDALSRLLRRSECRLRSFVWFEPSGNAGLPPEDFILHTFSSHSPTFLDQLVHLRVVSQTTDLHLKTLTLTIDKQSMPHLETIVLEQCWSSDGMLSDMLISRRATLKSVSAVMCGEGMILNPRFTKDLSLGLLGVKMDIRRG